MKEIEENIAKGLDPKGGSAEGGRKRYEKPAILSKEALELVANTCLKGAGDGGDCGSGWS